MTHTSSNSFSKTFMLLLASTSSTRKALLERLQLPFNCIAPQVDETPLLNEQPRALALRLAQEKALAVAKQYPDAWVIGSDQVAFITNGSITSEGITNKDAVANNQTRLEKPLTVERAISQLQACSGKQVCFETAVCLKHLSNNTSTTVSIPFWVQFRDLTLDEIIHYINAEMPLHCAGSFMCEGLGITLFESMTGEDQTALMGLPLLALCKMLREAGFILP